MDSLELLAAASAPGAERDKVEDVLWSETDDHPWDDDPYCIGTKGSVKFLVISNCVDHSIPWPWRLWRKGKYHRRLFELDILEYDGCASWAAEGYGLADWITDHVPMEDLKVGGIYTATGMTVSFTSGDRWETDDDEDWEWEDLIRHHHLGHRIAAILLSRYMELRWFWRYMRGERV
jgi:hypothetical protein